MLLRGIVSKKEQVTYQAVVKAINELKADGHTPSVRLIRSRVGGSNSTLLEYLRRWQGEIALASTTEDNISEVFQQSLKAEFGRMTLAIREKYEAALQQEKQQNKESQELLSEAETKVADLELQARENTEKSDRAILKLEKQLAAAIERTAELQRQADKNSAKADKQMESLQHDMTLLQNEKHQSEIKVAILETKLSALEKTKPAK